MNRISLLLLAAALLSPATYAQISCTRDGLKAAADLYVAAQAKGDTAGLPLANGLGYVENFKPIAIAEGLIKKPMKIDHTMHLIDTSTCQTFTEVIVTDKANPYVLGTRMRINHGLIAEIEMLWTTTGYWLFNADNYLKYAKEEDWGPIATNKRDSRATIVAAANAASELAMAAQALRDCGIEPEFKASGGGSDVNALLVNGFPSVNLCNAMVDVHTPDERIRAHIEIGGLLSVAQAARRVVDLDLVCLAPEVSAADVIGQAGADRDHHVGALVHLAAERGEVAAGDA